MGNSTVADIEDLTAPSDIDGPSHIVITVGANVTAQYSAEDPSGIGQWAVNDTVNFAIDSTGLLISIADLPVGEYTIRIGATDSYGHTTYHNVTISVEAPTGGGLPTTMFLAIGAGGAILVLVVVVIAKKRGT